MARILVAEPDQDVLALVERALAGWGHEAIRYRPGAALPQVDVMLLEPGMGPRVVGLAEVLASGSPPAQLVVVSIHPPEAPVHALRPVAYVVKPFSLGALQAAVEKAVRRGERLR